MRVLLVDVDSKIPNLALMKLSQFFKLHDYSVTLVQLRRSYYPGHKIVPWKAPQGYDLIAASAIFPGTICNLDFGHTPSITGGTGFDISSTLPSYIENLKPDYSLYPENKISYGFISRGCIRKCSFCWVPKKEGGIRQVATVADIVQHKEVVFMDNNILALPNCCEILEELGEKQISCSFNQGLDIRLVTPEISDLLRQLRYKGEYIFAFDDWKLLSVITEKLCLLSWRKPWGFKFFVYLHPSMNPADIMNRLYWLKEHQCLPYLMRDIACWSSPDKQAYTDLAAWCNQPAFFKHFSFGDFLTRRVNQTRKLKTLEVLHS